MLSEEAYQITENVVSKAKLLFRQSIPLHSLITAQEYPLFNHLGPSFKDVSVEITACCKERLLDELPSLVIANLCVSRVLDSPEVVNEIHVIRRDSDAAITVSLFSTI